MRFVVFGCAVMLLTASCITPRGRSCLGFLEKCGKEHRCVEYLEQNGLEATCEVPCKADSECPEGERCKLPGETEYGAKNICVPKQTF